MLIINTMTDATASVIETMAPIAPTDETQYQPYQPIQDTSQDLTPGQITGIVFGSIGLILYIAAIIHSLVTCIVNWNSKDLEKHNRSALFLILTLAFPSIFPLFYWFIIFYYWKFGKK